MWLAFFFCYHSPKAQPIDSCANDVRAQEIWPDIVGDMAIWRTSPTTTTTTLETGRGICFVPPLPASAFDISWLCLFLAASLFCVCFLLRIFFLSCFCDKRDAARFAQLATTTRPGDAGGASASTVCVWCAASDGLACHCAFLIGANQQEEESVCSVLGHNEVGMRCRRERLAEIR